MGSRKKGKVKVTVISGYKKDKDGVLVPDYKTGYIPKVYIRVFLEYAEDYANLLLTSRRILHRILSEYTIQRKEVRLDVDFMLEAGWGMSFLPSFRNGVSELKKKEWIIKTDRGSYNINGTKIYCGHEKYRLSGTIILPEQEIIKEE
jgi:hypothetical protein